MTGALDILYRDDALLAVQKPSGLLVHRGMGRDRVTLVDLVRDLTGAGKVHPAQRLDRGASGVMLFAMDGEIARLVGAMFERGEVRKAYLALVRGRAPDEGVVDHPLAKKEGGPRLPSVTAYRRLATVEAEPREVSLVLALTQSGRLHQVRRHLRHVNHPLIGDANYGHCALNRAFRERHGLGRLALHAAAIALLHPVTGAALRIDAPLPDDLRRPLVSIGFPGPVLDQPPRL